MQKIILASANKKKCAEIQSFFADFPIELMNQSELKIPSIEETELSFVENALLKARHASRLSGLPALADDSGLVVDCLNGAPGVYSARYAGIGADDAALIKKLLEEMDKVECSNRSARFHCIMVLLLHPADPAPLICQGVWEGSILKSGRGQQGFGYDPIFYVPTHGCSAAELSAAEKNQYSHRATAMKQLLQKIPSIINSEC
jgi:XTP/dITP diphosphohydrolase